MASYDYDFITGCDRYSTWASLLIGLVAGPIFIAADKLLLACRIDDPVNAVPVNGVGGEWVFLFKPFISYYNFQAFSVSSVLLFLELTARACFMFGISRVWSCSAGTWSG